MGDSVSPVAEKKQDRLLIVCLFWDLVASLLARNQRSACASFGSGFIYNSRPLEETTAPTYFPLENLLSKCAVHTFAACLSSVLAFFQNTQSQTKLISRRTDYSAAVSSGGFTKLLCDRLLATHLQPWPRSTLGPSSCWHICDILSVKAKRREIRGRSRPHLLPKRRKSSQTPPPCHRRKRGVA